MTTTTTPALPGGHPRAPVRGGLQLGPWLLEERLARGGMAEVWRGRRVAGSSEEGSSLPGVPAPDVDIVCIKRLDPGLTTDPDFVEMFRDEARLVLGLEHDNVVRTWALYDDNPGGQPQELLLIMELVDGPSLANLTRALHASQAADSPTKTTTAPPTLAEALTIALQLARALHHVHTRVEDGAPLSIVHRDVSPQNLLIDGRGRVVLIDFGVARAASRLTHTKKGTLKGKAAYMAPEQVRGEVVDARTDQFAAAVVLWELLCRRPLFHGNNELRVLEQIERADVVRPSMVAPDLLTGLEALDPRQAKEIVKDVDALVMKALSFRREERFVDMAAFATATASILGALGGPADLVPLVQRGRAAIEVSGPSSEQPTRTRVLETDPRRPGAPFGVSDEAFDVDASLVARRRRRATWPLVVGAAVVVGVVGVGIALATSGVGVGVGGVGGVDVVATDVVTDGADGADGADAGPSTEASPATAAVGDVDGLVRRIERLERSLKEAPSHPCRTELLDELFDRPTLTPAVVTAIAVDAGSCVSVAAQAPALRASLEKKKLLQPPPPPRTKKKRRPSEQQIARRNDELTRRGQLALDAGASDVARTLLELVVSADHRRVDERRLLAEAYRRDGEQALAGVELRAFLQARPDDPERARLLRWLKLNDLPLP